MGERCTDCNDSKLVWCVRALCIQMLILLGRDLESKGLTVCCAKLKALFTYTFHRRGDFADGGITQAKVH